jgi:imidazolonepropionase-like amidohydrolase
VADALLFKQPVASEKFPVKMLRWVEVSSKGDKVLYQALGHIYVRDLPNGTPRRLTSQNEHFEFYPTFSRDGQWVVFTTWDDQKFGSVRMVSANGGEERVLTTEPGHYVEPAISPDGKVVVYRKIEGGFTRSPQWGMNLGVYWGPAEGGKPTLIRKDASDPQFGAASDRVYLVTRENEDKRGLRSIDLDGSDDRLHLQSEDATEFRIAPDEKWVAFTERFNAYIAPFVPTGKTVDISPDTKAVPVAKVSRDAGEYLHWAGDSKRLYWALGPELYWRDLKEAFAFIEGAPEKLPEPAAKGLNIGFETNYDKPEGSLALVGARIITMRGSEIINNGTIVVDGNKISAIGPSGSVAIPANAKRVDVKGMTIIPGIVDYHWHGAQGQDEITPEQNWTNFSSLAFGVTTIHDPSNDNSEIFAAAELGKAGMIVGPRIYSTGTILYGAKAAFKAVIETPEDAESHLRRMKAIGAFSVKSYNQPRRDQRQQVIKAARELNMLVVPEGGSLIEHNLTMIVDGHTTIEHSIPVSALYKDAVQLWTQSKTGYTPTLIVGYGGLWGENYWYQKTNVWENQRLLKFVPREVVDSRARRRTMAPDDEWNHFNNAHIAADLAKRGVNVQIGAHGQREGLGAHWELWMLVQGGLTPHEALRAATLSGAKQLGMDAEIGSLEKGKLADLVVLDKNPLENIRNSESIRYTMVNGRLYDAMKMNEVGTRTRARQAFYWEVEQAPASADSSSN